jgi:hypothetical protein
MTNRNLAMIALGLSLMTSPTVMLAFTPQATDTKMPDGKMADGKMADGKMADGKMAKKGKNSKNKSTDGKMDKMDHKMDSTDKK